jgi:type II secretory pathway pseudopilin PulG
VSLMHQKRAGDTLVEVMLAFAILSAVISVAFSGAMGSYRSALTAQNRTQALFLAQYQADGLKTYRDSLDWDNGGGLPSFLDGTINNLGPGIVGVRNLGANQGIFCMETSKQPGQLTQWKISQGLAPNEYCQTQPKLLAPNLIDPKMEITLKNINNPVDRVEAIITVSYKAANANIREKVTNSIILIK